MPNAADIQPDKDISMLFKGPPGYSKSIAALSLAAFGDVWIAYFDKRRPIEIFMYLKKIGRADLLPRITFESYTAINANKYLNDLDEVCNGKGRGKYVGIISDSATNMTAASINWSMKFRGSKRIDDNEEGASRLTPNFDDYKVETNYITQALDLTSSYPGFNIWTAHPLNSLDMKASGSGKIQSISTKQTLVSYGNKVGQLIPGRFQEIYHFSKQAGKRVVWTDADGDDFAKTCYPMPRMLDIEGKLFFEVWKEAVNKSLEVYNEVKLTDPTTAEINKLYGQPEQQQTKWKV